mmetsp:Transcript_61030/g.111817  ORF Transcript_61030/g.111817 Transcript_61030/m.111817 type:complete len:648 (-) Transcript_61030:60-2003(-)
MNSEGAAASPVSDMNDIRKRIRVSLEQAHVSGELEQVPALRKAPGASNVAAAQAPASSHRPAESSAPTDAPPRRSLPLAERLQLARCGPTLIFDGVCNLCNASMRWYFERLLEEDSVNFMWAQHEDTQVLLKELGISDIYKSWAYLKDEIVYRGSSAWFQAMDHLCAPWRWLGSFSNVPPILREGAYSIVSSNRYSMLGKSNACQVPPPGMIQCFLHDPFVSANDEPASAEQLNAPDVKQRLLIVGCGSAGIQIVRQLAHEFNVTLVEPKDYYEFTPGILRGLCDPQHLSTLHLLLADAFKNLPVTHIRGQVVGLHDRHAEVWLNGTSESVEVPFDYVVVAAGSQYAGNSLWKITGAPGEESQFSLSGRAAGLEQARKRLLELRDRGGTVVMVGAGLVGVELAAELADYIKGLRLVLADLAPSVLPVMSESAQKHAKDWLTKHGVELRLGVPLPRGSDAEVAAALGLQGEVLVLGCAGVSMRCNFMAPLNCLNQKGEVRVNRAGQVLSNSPSEKDVAVLGPERAAVCGQGRIFALGDCVCVEDADRFPKNVYPAEAMSKVISSNLELAKRVRCLRTCPGILHEIRASLQDMTLCSLGPRDCIFEMNGYAVATGFVATNMKHQIEVTKMGELRNEWWGSFVWSMVPHF